jgi:polyisoprenoid-binding protein YceI
MKFPSKTLALLAAACGLATAASAVVETYAIDPVHSSVGFKIRHIVGKVPGAFTKFSGTIVVDRDNLENSSVEATIDVGSISTFNEHRDADLKSPSYFDAAQFATMTFKSKSWKKTGDGTFDVTGDLTIHGVTKEVVLKVTLLAFGPGMQGAQLSGWDASAAIKRSDFGINGPPGMGAMLGDDVAISITVEAKLKKDAEAPK